MRLNPDFAFKMTDFNGPIKTFSYTMSVPYNNTRVA
jgi:hypothetical protein